MSARPLVVVGDALLDVDLVGSSTRLAPDAPVPVIDDVEARERPFPRPHRLLLDGDAHGAAACWQQLGSPYDQALAMIDTGLPAQTFAALETLDRLEGEGRVAFRYADDVNGSQRSIAGVLNEAGNVLGMMPHPERAIEPAHGGSDGRRLFEAALKELAGA